MNELSNSFEISVFFDGACPLCSREIDVYKKKDKAGKIKFVDIAAMGFNPSAFSLDPKAVRRYLHVKRTRDNKIYSGLDAFVAIWNCLPGSFYRLLGTMFSFTIVQFFLKPFYHVFAIYIRPHLPRRKKDCNDDVCQR